jgi:hypothetical protein
VIAAEEATRKLAEDAAAIGIDALRTGGSLDPFLVIELDGLRDTEHFAADALPRARERAARLSRPSAGRQACALVYAGRVGVGQEAVLVEVQRAGSDEVEVFRQAYRPRGGRLRPFKPIGDLTFAGRREALA